MAERAETSRALADLLRDAPRFIAEASLLPLRAYQLAVAQAVLDSVLQRRGLSFVVMFPRQSGKNELQAQLEAYLLLLFSEAGAEIVKVSPTWKPQSLNAMRRLQRVLETNRLTGPLWRKESGYIYRVGRARIFFLSGAPETNIVGATAGTLLEVDEAQDVTIAKFDKDIAPMAASTNATRVFWGTAWTASTLLARELRAARAAEQEDGIRRTFVLTADEVGDEVPAYRTFVNEQVRRLGRTHPLVRTQFFSEELDSGGGMFTAARRQLMTGSHPPLDAPQPGKAYALLLDAAGADEGVAAGSAELANPARDAADLASELAWTGFSFAAPVALGAGIPFWVVVSRTGAVSAASHYRAATDAACGYAGGQAKLYNGAAWVLPAVPVDLNFRVVGVESAAAQFLRIPGTLAHGTPGQFLAGVRVEGAAGARLPAWRDGTSTAGAELRRLLEVGDPCRVEVTPERWLAVSPRPEPVAACRVGLDGTLKTLEGAPLPLGRVEPGVWAAFSPALRSTPVYLPVLVWTPRSGLMPVLR